VKSVLTRTAVVLVVGACACAPHVAGVEEDDAGPAAGEDGGAGVFGLHGSVGTVCSVHGEVTVTCAEGLVCSSGVCQPPYAADAGEGTVGHSSEGGHAMPDAQADTGGGATPDGQPTGPTLAVGGDHVCALHGGTLECWGANYAGELGIGVGSGPQTCGGGFACSPAPVAVTGLSTSVESVAAGQDETCALLAGGTVACWGANDSGQLGDGSTSGPESCPNGSCSTTPAVVPGLSGATAVATDGGEACALLSSGVVKCWGGDAFGALGNGTPGPGGSLVPVMVSGLTQATAIAMGYDYACALSRDGTVQCWGSNNGGQLGNGSTANSTTPVPASNLTGATAVATGWYHTCALLKDGTVACWGTNADGELGLGSTFGPQTCGMDTCSLTPVKVPNLSGVTAIAAGTAATCALLSDGTVRCWGWNAYGQLGNGTGTNSATPVVVSGVSGATAIAMGNDTACALLSNGGVECWGDGAMGQLGRTVSAGLSSCGSCSATAVNVAGL
jgi:alpha-tubulin suppressor-like RCC1 family protein